MLNERDKSKTLLVAFTLEAFSNLERISAKVNCGFGCLLKAKEKCQALELTKVRNFDKPLSSTS